MAVISGVMFAGFPFDNLCTSEYLVVPEEFHRTWTVRPKIVDEQNWLIKQVFGDQSERIEVQISQNTSAYYYCLQDWRRAKFHEEDEDGESPLDIVWSESIQDEQGVVVYIFYILTLSCIGVSLLYYLCVCCRHLMSVSGIRYTYKARGRDQRRGYSELEDGVGIYVPQVMSSQFNYPLLACRVDKLPECIFDWHDPDRDYTYYDMTQDVERLLLGDILRLCDNVLDVKPEIMLRGLVDEGKGKEVGTTTKKSPEEVEKVLRKKVRSYFRSRLIFSIVKEWHHSEPGKRADNRVHGKDGLVVDVDGVEITSTKRVEN